MSEETKDPWKELRKPFPSSAVGKLPKGGTLLDYVGHAAVTDRLLEVDPMWKWEPFALDEVGLPAMDAGGNLWIKLTICGVTRPGVGDGKNMKERIGDALRNAAMRFGVALDLWSKEELRHGDEDPGPYDAGVDQATGEVRMIDRGQLITLKALEAKLGKGGQDETPEARKQRLGWYHWAIGREVNSSKDLTQSEAEMVIAELRKRVPAEEGS